MEKSCVYLSISSCDFPDLHQALVFGTTMNSSREQVQKLMEDEFGNMDGLINNVNR